MQLVLAQDRLRVALRDSLQALDAARLRIEITRAEIDLAIKVEEAERVRLSHGDSNILLVNLREQTTADARSKLIDVLNEFQRAKADYFLAAGISTP